MQWLVTAALIMTPIQLELIRQGTLTLASMTSQDLTLAWPR